MWPSGNAVLFAASASARRAEIKLSRAYGKSPRVGPYLRDQHPLGRRSSRGSDSRGMATLDDTFVKPQANPDWDRHPSGTAGTGWARGLRGSESLYYRWNALPPADPDRCVASPREVRLEFVIEARSLRFRRAATGS